MSDNSLGMLLKEKIEKYKREKPELSSKQIAKKLEISVSTFHRLENDTCSNPGIDIAFKILFGTGNHGMIPNFLKEYYGDSLELYESVYKNNICENSCFQSKDIEKYFSDSKTFKLMVLATAN